MKNIENHILPEGIWCKINESLHTLRLDALHILSSEALGTSWSAKQSHPFSVQKLTDSPAENSSLWRSRSDAGPPEARGAGSRTNA